MNAVEPRILVIIVNYRTSELVIDCLASLENELPSLPGMQAVVTDNASGRVDLAALELAINRRGWDTWVDLVPLPRNGGFAYGNNRAIDTALVSDDPPDFILLLNPDTIIRPGAIAALVGFMNNHPDAAIAGSRLEDPDGTPQRSAFRSITPGSELLTTARLGLIRRLVPRWEIALAARDEPHPADWLAGASMLIRRSVFETIGTLDEAYFLYFEEVDFCLRARRAGLRCWYVPDSRVIHLVGAATGVSGNRVAPKRRPAYWFRSRRHYFLKNWGRGGAFLADLNWIAGLALWRMRAFVQRRQNPDPPHFLKDFLSHSVFFGGFDE